MFFCSQLRAPFPRGGTWGRFPTRAAGWNFSNFPQRAATLKRESTLSLEDGFCCLICHVAFRAAPAAFGQERRGRVRRKKTVRRRRGKGAGQGGACRQRGTGGGAAETVPYDDEIVATENYYEYPDANVENLTIKEKSHEEQPGLSAVDAVADAVDTGEERAEETACGADADADEDAVRLFKVESPGNENGSARYYDSVKGELDELFEKYPSEDNLQRAVEDSRWVKIEFAPQKYYTVGLMFEKGKPRYICYGVPAANKSEPPAALKGFCSYLPLSLFDLRGKGYWMMYQDADTGRCVEISAT